jgi:hypothetical protein
MNANKPAESKCWNSGSDSSQTLKDLLLILERITAAGAGFRSLTESIDTTVPAGRMMMQMLGAFAEYEREMVKERKRSLGGVLQQRRGGAYFFPLWGDWGDGGTVGVLEYGGCLCHNVES